MPDRTSHFVMAENVLGQDLAEFIISRREQDPPVTFARIARDLRDATHGVVDVTVQTIHNWYWRLVEDVA